MTEIESVLAAFSREAVPGIDLSLDRMHALLDALDNPHTKVPPVIHIAGTNGKASTLAFLQGMAEASDMKVHCYTSPHLVRFHERITLAGKEVSDAQLLPALKRVHALLPTIKATYFEAVTAAAFLLFAEHDADLLLLETGLGGRLDATNVIEKPIASIITPVSFDHMEYLGDTLTKITKEKAGIMRPYIPCIIAPQHLIALDALRDAARTSNTPLYIYDNGWRIEESKSYRSSKLSQILPELKLAGEHQKMNAATALACVDMVNQRYEKDECPIRFDLEKLAQGLQSATLRARLQPITHHPYLQMLPEGWEIWLDGGHNPAAASVLSQHIQKHWQDKPLILICGMMKDKEIEGFLSPLVPHAHYSFAVPIEEDEARAASAEYMQSVLKGLGARVELAPDLESAFTRAGLCSLDPARILVCGSLYLAGNMLQAAEG